MSVLPFGSRSAVFAFHSLFPVFSLTLKKKCGYKHNRSHLVAGRSVGVDGIAVAVLAARSAGDVPRIGSAAVAVLTDHVGPAGTLAAALVALTLIGGRTGPGYRPRRVARALCTARTR